MSFRLPKLRYAYGDLHPHIDKKTMKIHHSKHHAGYVKKLNKSIKDTKYNKWELEKLLAGLKDLPSEIKSSVRNNGGGHANHSLFWKILSPETQQPSGELKKVIDNKFGGINSFKEKFTESALSRFGSGWGWLVVDKNKKLKIYSTANQDSPIAKGDTPILGVDVWEHAYYLKYQNRRADYLKAFMKVINWDQAEKNFKAAVK